jgi:hypothetical protein
MKLKAVFFVLFFAALIAVGAELRIPRAPISPPLGVGTGLNGSFFSARDVDGNNESALAVALESQPSVSFVARLIDYGNGESGGQTLQAFLGANLPDPHATSLSAPGTFDVNPSVFRFTGYINITRPVVNFAVTSDDGSRLSIGGVTIIDNGGAHGNSFGPGVVTVRFPAPGLYPIEILYNETQGQGAYLGFFSDIPGGPATCPLCGAAAPEGTVGVVPTAVLFPARGRGLLSRLTGGQEATKFWVEFSQPSGGVGDVIDGTVGLASSTERFVRSDRDVPIILQTRAGKFSGVSEGNRVVIPSGASLAKFKLILEKAGDFLVRASSPGEKIQEAQTVVTVCADNGDAERMIVDQPTNEGTVGGEGIPFSLRFVDSGATPVKAKEGKEYTLQSRGVDVWTVLQLGENRQLSHDVGTLKKGSCRVDHLVYSSHPGLGAVTATFIKDTHELPFTFYLEFQPGWFLLTALGSVCGAFVRLQTHSRRTKKLLRYYFVAVIAGIGLFLFYYYLPSNHGARITVGGGRAFLLGLGGGYLGPMTVDRISKFLLPSLDPRREQRGQL